MPLLTSAAPLKRSHVHAWGVGSSWSMSSVWSERIATERRGEHLLLLSASVPPIPTGVSSGKDSNFIEFLKPIVRRHH